MVTANYNMHGMFDDCKKDAVRELQQEDQRTVIQMKRATLLHYYMILKYKTRDFYTI